MKRYKLYAILIIITLITFSGLFYYFYEPSKEVSFEKELEEGLIDIYCPLQLSGGTFKTDDLATTCNDSNLFSEEFEVNLIDQVYINNLEGQQVALGLYQTKRGIYSPRYRVIAIKKDRGQIFTQNLEGKPKTIKKQKDFILLGEEKYRLIDDNRLEKVSESFKSLTSPDYGFSVKLPENWEAENIKNGYSFYHPNSRHSYPITLNIKGNQFNFSTSKKTPYKQEYEKIKESLVVNQNFENLADYTVFKNELEDYLEIDAVNKKINYYQNNRLINSFNIWATGSPYNWQGTPGGLYKIISKEGLRFSSVSEVYMPFSMRIYGKYLVHGEPYYPSGVPYTSDVSGGCVRVRNNEMEKLYDLVEEDLPVLSITNKHDNFSLGNDQLTEFPRLTADSFLVADLESGKIFAGKNINKKKSIASITKMMTAIVATEQMDIARKITIKDYMLEEYGETEGLTAGRRVRLVDLLNPLLIKSSNDSALILAHYLGRDNTLEKMNQKTKTIGMKNSSFVDFSGFKKENISTAKDLYYLAYYLANTRIPLLNISKRVQVPEINYNAFPDYDNKNLFYDQDDFLGGKTGFTNDAKYTGFFIFNMRINGENRRIVFIHLGVNRQNQLKNEVLNLKNWLNKAYNKNI